MLIGVPKEIKTREYRVAMTPAGVRQLVAHGHRVLVEHTAGEGSGLSDELYVAAGATIERPIAVATLKERHEEWLPAFMAGAVG